MFAGGERDCGKGESGKTGVRDGIVRGEKGQTMTRGKGSTNWFYASGVEGQVRIVGESVCSGSANNACVTICPHLISILWKGRTGGSTMLDGPEIHKV